MKYCCVYPERKRDDENLTANDEEEAGGNFFQLLFFTLAGNRCGEFLYKKRKEQNTCGESIDHIVLTCSGLTAIWFVFQVGLLWVIALLTSVFKLVPRFGARLPWAEWWASGLPTWPSGKTSAPTVEKGNRPDGYHGREHVLL